MGKLNCEIVKDLLPNYMEELTSGETNRAIEEHLNECETCRTIYDEMRQIIPVEKAPEEVPVKSFLNKVKSRYVMDILTLLGVVAVVICGIVNLAVDHKLSWSLIVLGSIVYFLAVAQVFVSSKKHKIVKSVLCICVLLLPFLGLIQVTLEYLMDTSYGMWFWSAAVPISLLWMVTIWIWIGIIYGLKQSWIINTGILCLLVVPANALTNIFAGQYDGMSDYMMNFISNGLASLVVGIILIIIGVGRKRTKNVDQSF